MIDLDTIRRALAQHVPRLDDDPSARRAAVSIVLHETSSGPEVLLLRRAEREDDPWSGHMAFPGGRMDPEDRDLYDTAVRETREEVGLDLVSMGEHVARLDDLPAIARGRRMGLTIAPFVFTLREVPPLVPNEEVAEVLWAPLVPLFAGDAGSTIEYRHENAIWKLPAFDVNGRTVWGLTYQMLQHLFDRVRAVAR